MHREAAKGESTTIGTAAISFGAELATAGRAAIAASGSPRWFERVGVRLSVTSTALLGVMCLSMSGRGGALMTAPLVGVALAVQLMQGHEWLHQSRNGHSGRVRAVFAIAIAPTGLSPSYWQTKHNRLHHVGADRAEGFGEGPLAIGLVARLSSDQPWRPWHRFQVVYFPLLAALEHHLMFVENIRFARTGRIGGFVVAQRPTRRWVFGHLLACLSGPVVFVALATALHGPWVAVSIWIVASLVCGAVLSAVLAVEVVHRGTGDATGSCRSDTWSRWHIERSMSIDTHPVVEWLTGGLTRHTEHHLFPHASASSLRTVTPALEAVCRRHAVTLHRYPSLRSSWRAFAAYLIELGRRPQVSAMSPSPAADPNASVIAFSPARIIASNGA